MPIRRVLIVLLGVSIFAIPSLAEMLTKAKLLELQQAGVTSGALIALIRNGGVGFSVDADTILELKRGGIADDVLQALIEARAATKPAAPSATSIYSPAQEAYSAGDYSKAADTLRGILKSTPSDPRAQALLAMACMKARDAVCGEAAYADLQKNTLPAAAPLRARVAPVFDDLHEQERVKQALEAALRRFDRKGCLKAIRESKLAPQQKAILEAWIDVYSGEYAAAREKVRGLASELAAGLTASFAEYEKRATTAQCSLSWRSGDPICPLPKSLVEEYVELNRETWAALDSKNYSLAIALGDPSSVKYAAHLEADLVDLLRAAPLTQASANYLFEASFLTRPYDEAKVFNDQLLETLGTLSVPYRTSDVKVKFVGKTADEFSLGQRLVIDGRNQRLTISSTAGISDFKQHPLMRLSGSYHELQVSPSNFAFSQISVLRQKVKTIGGTPCIWLQGTVMLDLGGNFLLSGSSILPSAVGDAAGTKARGLVQLQYMRDFGRYIWSLNPHAMGRPSLVEVKAAQQGPGLFSSVVMMTAGLASAAAPSAGGRYDLQALGRTIENFFGTMASTSEASRSNAAGEPMQAWDRMAVEKAFQSVFTQSFTALGTLWSAAEIQ